MTPQNSQKRTEMKHSLTKNHTNVFLGLSPKAIEIKAKIRKWDPIKLTSFCIAKKKKQKNTINKMKRQPIKWEKILANDVTNRVLSPKYTNSSHSSITKKQPNGKMSKKPKETFL